jgi:acyl-CoA synthetase (AMP-forming)/AMP-acid ligase II
MRAIDYFDRGVLLKSVKAPKAVEFWDVLPRTSVGKVDKKAIREKFWAGRSRQVN